jgi:magnesium transporter
MASESPACASATVIRALDARLDSAAATTTEAGPEALRPTSPGHRRWIDIQAADRATLARLEHDFGYHPLALEDCSHFDQRPKVEDYDRYLFVVVHAFSAPVLDAPPGPAVDDTLLPAEPDAVDPRIDVDRAQVLELHAFLSDDLLVTIHEEPLDKLNELFHRIAADPTPLRRGVDVLYYTLADSLVDSHFPLLDAFTESLDQVEEAMLSRHPTAGDLHQLFTLRSMLVRMRRFLSPQRDVFALLARRVNPVGRDIIREATVPYFRDVYDHVVRITEAIDAGRELLGNALDAYRSATSNRTNEIMKRLTIFSAIFLPLSFLVGFFGMNFHAIPYDHAAWLSTAVGIMVAVPVGMLLWFRLAKWL